MIQHFWVHLNIYIYDQLQELNPEPSSNQTYQIQTVLVGFYELIYYILNWNKQFWDNESKMNKLFNNNEFIQTKWKTWTST